MLTAKDALNLSSSHDVSLDNFGASIGTRLKSLGITDGFRWAAKTTLTTEDWADLGQAQNEWHEIGIDFSEAKALKPFLPCNICVLFDGLRCSLEEQSLIIRCIRRLFLEVVAKYRAQLRQSMVMIILDTQDANSLCHKILNLFVSMRLCNSGSIFLLNPENDYLVLSATTGLKQSLQKKDVFYTKFDKSWVRDAFDEWKIIDECNATLPLKENRFGESTAGRHIVARTFIPISFQNKHKTESMRWPISGVLRLLRLEHGPQAFAQATKSREFTWLDHYVFDFAAEVMHIVLQGNLNAWGAHSANEKIAHGIKSGVDGSLEIVRTLNYVLFDDERRAGAELSKLREAFRQETRLNVPRLLRNAQYFLQDASEQIEIVTAWTVGTYVRTDGSRPVTRRLFADVLQKAVNLAPQIAVVNSAKVPIFNNLKECGADRLPSVIGDEALLLTVFRNLIENAIKYAKQGERADIEITFNDIGEELQILVGDRGIGIPDYEIRSLFTEGFRGRGARQASNRGRGFGLAHCRKILREFGGGLNYRADLSDKGNRTYFVVHLEKAQAL